MTGPTSRGTGLRVIVEADGGSRGNPGPAGYGSVVLASDGVTVLADRKDYIGIETNNVAEYRGLIAGLAAAAELGASEVLVRMDSKLVVEQMSGRWQVKHPAMRPLAREATELRAHFDRVDFEWIPRGRNTRADKLANEAMDTGTGKTPKAAKAAVRAEPPVTTQPVTSKPTGSWIPPTSLPTRLILVRHGVTAYSVERRFAGRSDLDLIETGVEQARAAADRVAKLGGIDAIVASPLTRTRHTARLIAERLGLPVHTDDGFVETDFGTWDGFTFAEIQQRWPEDLTRWLADPALAPPGGESFEEVGLRVRGALDRVLAAHPEQTVVVVSHVTPIKLLVAYALGAPISSMHRMYVQPASVSVIDYFDDGNCALRSFNENGHLPD